MPALSRIKDKPCPWCRAEGKITLIARASSLCHRHNGQKSGRTFNCQPHCRLVHQRCPGCGELSGPGHQRKLRDGVCFLIAGSSCWSERYNDGQPLVAIRATCGSCSRSVLYGAQVWPQTLGKTLLCPRAHCRGRLMSFELEACAPPAAPLPVVARRRLESRRAATPSAGGRGGRHAVAGGRRSHTLVVGSAPGSTKPGPVQEAGLQAV